MGERAGALEGVCVKCLCLEGVLLGCGLRPDAPRPGAPRAASCSRRRPRPLPEMRAALCCAASFPLAPGAGHPQGDWLQRGPLLHPLRWSALRHDGALRCACCAARAMLCCALGAARPGLLRGPPGAGPCPPGPRPPPPLPPNSALAVRVQACALPPPIPSPSRSSLPPRSPLSSGRPW